MAATAIAYRKSPVEKAMQEMGPLKTVEKMSKEAFKAFAAEHQEIQLERESDGTIIIIPLVHGGSGKRETKVIVFIGMWQLQTGLGEVYGSTTGFDLPDGSTRAPDAAWISDLRLAELSAEEEETGFIPVVPDFVAEVRSASDRITKVKEKMQDVWMKNGVRLGWVIDPYNETVYIYRENHEPEGSTWFHRKKTDGRGNNAGIGSTARQTEIEKEKVKNSPQLPRNQSLQSLPPRSPSPLEINVPFPAASS